MASEPYPELAWADECWQWRKAFGGCSQATMAAYAYVSPATWSRWEAATCAPAAHVKLRVRHELERLAALHRNSVPADPES